MSMQEHRTKMPSIQQHVHKPSSYPDQESAWLRQHIRGLDTSMHIYNKLVHQASQGETLIGGSRQCCHSSLCQWLASGLPVEP